MVTCSPTATSAFHARRGAMTARAAAASAAAAREVAGDAFFGLAGDERAADGHENLVDVIETGPQRVARGVRELHAGRLPARVAVDVGDLADGRGVASSRDDAGRLLGERAVRRRVVLRRRRLRS